LIISESNSTKSEQLDRIQTPRYMWQGKTENGETENGERAKWRKGEREKGRKGERRRGEWRDGARRNGETERRRDGKRRNGRMNFRLAPDFSRVEKEHTHPFSTVSTVFSLSGVKIPPVSPLSQRGEKPPKNHESGFSPLALVAERSRSERGRGRGIGILKHRTPRYDFSASLRNHSVTGKHYTETGTPLQILQSPINNHQSPLGDRESRLWGVR
jgi:hypothetical protein